MKPVKQFFYEVWYRFKLIFFLCLLLLVVFFVDEFMDGYLKRFGIIPRDTDKLFHVLSAPFLHSNWQHLVNNLLGLSIFSAFCLTKSVRFYVLSSTFIIVLTGLLVWVFGRHAIHIGASGWIYGLWGLSMALAWFDRSAKHIFMAVVVAALYSGMVHGVLPQEKSISFESHLFGVVSGVFCAYLYGIWINKMDKKEEAKT